MDSITISTNSIRLINYATSLQETYATTDSPYWNFTTLQDLKEHLYMASLFICKWECQTDFNDWSFIINTSINKKPRYNHQFIISSI